MVRPNRFHVRLKPLCRVWALSIITLSAPLQAQQGVQVRAEDGYLWIQANNASASELANEISQSLGISVIVTGDTEKRINLDIVEEPLDKALSKLSPNNMLVRNGSAADSDIIEVILMMGEGTDSGSSSTSSQFLPSGSPAEPVMSEDQAQQILEASDPGALRDPDRARIVREAAAAATNDANMPPGQVPPMFAEDQAPLEDFAIDPATGLPIQNQ